MSKEKVVKCPRCKIKMTQLYSRTFGDTSQLYECPKCKGFIQR